MAATNHQESPLHMDQESSLQRDDVFLSMDEVGTVCIDEGGTFHMDLNPISPTVDMNDVIAEEEQQLVLQTGKFIFCNALFY
jgi:hypothetical protein